MLEFKNRGRKKPWDTKFYRSSMPAAVPQCVCIVGMPFLWHARTASRPFLQVSAPYQLFLRMTSSPWPPTSYAEMLRAHECIPDTDQRPLKNWTIFVSSVCESFKLLSSSKLSLDETNVLSAATGHMMRQQTSSKAELHSLQQHLPLITKLHATRADKCHALNSNPRKKGKRHCQNGLRWVFADFIFASQWLF